LKTLENQSKLRWLRTLAAALLLSMLFACSDPQSTVSSQAQPPTSVTVVELRSEPVALERELPGRTRAYLIAEIRPLVTGIVRERLFTEGSQVAAGDPLYQLIDSTYRATYKSARAFISRAESALELSQLNAERARDLRETNAISDQEYQTLLATERQAEADLEVARAQFESATLELEFARIRSPIAGRVGQSTVTQGALVTANQAAMLTIVQQLDPIYIDVTQSASELLSLRRALPERAIRDAEKIPVRVLLEDGTQYAYEGELTFADAAVDPMTGSIAMRAVVPNPDLMLLPGMYVRAVISNAVMQDGLLVPQRGITRDQSGNAIAMVVGADNKVETRIVDVGNTIGDRWVVRSGLAPGDRVIVEGLQKVSSGATVEPTVVIAEVK
jgi:membrane fusion protein (multidrug efflux system)